MGRAMIGFLQKKSDKSLDGQQQLAEHLAFEMARVVEEAAVASARTMGQGDRPGSDLAAVQAMRRAFEDVRIAGTIVIGEGERDEAPMLYIGERVGATPPAGLEYAAVDIAVDPLEGTNLCATGAANSIAVLAASEAGGLLHAPDCYMEKIIAGPGCQGALDLDAPSGRQSQGDRETIGSRRGRSGGDGAGPAAPRKSDRRDSQGGSPHPFDRRWRFIGGNRGGGPRRGSPRGDGNRRRSGRSNYRGRHALPARRDAGPAGGGQQEMEKRMDKMGISDPHKIYSAEDLAPGKKIIFAACGVTPGYLLQGVRFFGDGYRTHSLVMTSQPNTVSFRDTVHLTGKPDRRGVRLF